MTCHLHDVIEQIASRKLLGMAHHIISPQLQRGKLFDAMNKASEAVCFDLGVESTVDGLQQIPGMFRLPYPTCWFEFEIDKGAADEHGFIGALLQHEADDRLTMWVFGLFSPRRVWQFIGGASELRECVTQRGDEIYGVYWANTQAMQEGVVSMLWSYLSAMNCVNVTKVEHKPDAALQRARARRGRQPLYSTWTLNIDLNRGRSERGDGGGSHAAPRLHLRRGHARQFEPGRWTWVQAHVVGSKQAGIVHKDYGVLRHGT